MSDSTESTGKAPTSWFGDDAPVGPARLTNYVLLRNKIGQPITDQMLGDWALLDKIVAFIDKDGDEWRRDGSSFSLYEDGTLHGIAKVSAAVGPLCITQMHGVPNVEAEELLVLQRQRAQFDIEQQKDGADPNLKFQSTVQAQKLSWNKAWPVGSRVKQDFGDTETVWLHTVSKAYWYNDALVVDLCNGRNAVPVEGLTMRPSVRETVDRWNESHAYAGYRVQYSSHNGAFVETKAQRGAEVRGGIGGFFSTDSVFVDLDTVIWSETREQQAAEAAKLAEKIKHEMATGKITVMPPASHVMMTVHDETTPPMGSKEIPHEGIEFNKSFPPGYIAGLDLVDRSMKEIPVRPERLNLIRRFRREDHLPKTQPTEADLQDSAE